MVMFKWTGIEKKPFEDIKLIVAHDILLTYQDFNIQFDIHTGARDL